MKKDILIIAHFNGDLESGSNIRFSYIAKIIKRDYPECDIEIVTSDFSHEKKVKKGNPASEFSYFKTTMLTEPGYKKNISLRRFYSHWIFSKNVAKYLRTRRKPDVIYCAVPSLDVAYVTSKFAKKNKVEFIIDIQDLWPEAFKMVFDIPLISSIIFSPMVQKANKIYATANKIIAVSNTYLNRALKINKRCYKTQIVYLGTDLSKFDELKNVEPYLHKPHNEMWMAYIGTLGHSYDIICVLDALIVLKKQHKIDNFKFIIMGDGPLKKKFEDYAKQYDLPVVFTGMLSYPQMVAQLTRCDFAINPIRSGSAGSIINKVGDYAAAALPVINTQECLEYRELLRIYNCGINCDNGNVEQIANAIDLLCNNPQFVDRMGQASRKLAEDYFDRDKTYKKISDIIFDYRQ